MKILYLASKYKPQAYNGTIKFIENIVRKFSENNEVKLVSYCEETPEEYKNSNNIKYWSEIIDSVECLKFSTEEKYQTNYSLYNEEIYEFALKIIKEFNPDIIHIGHPRRVASFMKAAIDLNKKYIITLTDSLMVCPNTSLFTKSCEICTKRHQEDICDKLCGFDKETIKKNHEIVREYIDNAYALIAPSKFQAQIYEEYFKKDVFVIRHGNSIICNYEEKNYPKNKLIFGFNGSSMALKGLNLLVSVFNKIEKEYNVELHVYGPCDDTVRLLAGENVKFCGTYDNKEISKILNSIDILVCPSIWYENCPFVITEAFTNRVPVIATNEGGMKELVRNFINGFTFELGDTHQLIDIIKYTYDNQEIIIRLSNNLRSYKCKTVEDEMKEYEKIYSNSLANINQEKTNNLLVESLWLDLLKNKYDNIDIEKYKKCIIDSLKNYNYYASVDMIYRFIVRMNNIERIFKNKSKKSIIIWGVSTSGKLTMDILKNMYMDLEIKFFVDKYKNNQYINDIPIQSINVIEEELNDYIFICTNPGKKEADNLMKKLNKRVNIDYSYGMCIE